MGDSLEPFVPRPRTDEMATGISYSSSASSPLRTRASIPSVPVRSVNQQEIDSAVKISREGVAAAFLVAVITGICATAGFAGIEQSAMLDAVMFAGIGIGIYYMSRVASLAGLLLFVAEKIYMWSTHGFSNPIMAIFIAGAFLNSVRGTFKYHDLKR